MCVQGRLCASWVFWAFSGSGDVRVICRCSERGHDVGRCEEEDVEDQG